MAVPAPQLPPTAGPNFLGVQLPQGVKVEHPLPPFPPELGKALEAARRSGAYTIAVAIHEPLPNDPDHFRCHLHRVGTFKKDWLLRFWQAIVSLILTHELTIPGITPQPPQAPPAPPAPAEETIGG